MVGMDITKRGKDFSVFARISGEDNPEIVVNDSPYSYEINNIQPVIGIESNRAIGLIFGYDR